MDKITINFSGRFTDLPADVNPSLSLPVPIEQLELNVSYHGQLSSIGYEETTSVSNKSFADLNELEGEYVNIHEDLITPPIRLFIMQDQAASTWSMKSYPEDRENVELFIGTEGLYKIWITGKLALEGRSSAIWLPKTMKLLLSLSLVSIRS
ncbi:hypothetical protein [Paenibacillus eucommiae]|uniref:Uncharacterized protein n=1 Tax=Paenibacillus eucommiae TaxID=1355755 RepID=A0ABS4J1Y5_9BACL|nr:hypothetical protein [Paenibacillus eucommiae]MBP1993828.1 hypothetical protein [Paenibacillus eucommiae]